MSPPAASGSNQQFALVPEDATGNRPALQSDTMLNAIRAERGSLQVDRRRRGDIARGRRSRTQEEGGAELVCADWFFPGLCGKKRCSGGTGGGGKGLS